MDEIDKKPSNAISEYEHTKHKNIAQNKKLLMQAANEAGLGKFLHDSTRVDTKKRSSKKRDKKRLNLRGFQFDRPRRRESNLPKLAMPFRDIPFASSSLSVASGDGSSSGSGGDGKEVHKNHCLKESKLMSTLGSRTFSRRKKVI